MSIDIPLDNLSVAEKVQLLERVWENLCRQTGNVRSPDWHKAVLAERRRRLESGEATVSSWADAKDRLMKLGS
jgi:putative addiction module component (TIGR02574 family)